MDRAVVTTELKKLTGLAVPLVVTQLAQMGLGAVSYTHLTLPTTPYV